LKLAGNTLCGISALLSCSECEVNLIKIISRCKT
jgi:hypothetical protein